MGVLLSLCSNTKAIGATEQLMDLLDEKPEEPSGIIKHHISGAIVLGAYHFPIKRIDTEVLSKINISIKKEIKLHL